jgi:hypothetical protein
MMQQPLAHKIRHADTLAKHYFSTLGRLEASGKRRARKSSHPPDWSSVLDDEPNIDLYASTRKKLWIAGGVTASATVVLAIVAPGAAIGLGCVTAYLAVKVYKYGLRADYWG